MEGSFNQDGLVSSAAGRLRGGREEEEEVEVEREGTEQEDEEKEDKVEEKGQEEDEEDVKEEEVEVLVCCVRWQQNVNLYILC